MTDERGARALAALRRNADLLAAALLFAALLALSWRRWASFDGDLNREWTTPARLSQGERLYRDVAWYYGPLAPQAEALAFRAFGARVGTAIGFGVVLSAATLALVLLGARAFLPLSARLGAGLFAVGVFAFAPENGAFVAPYSMSALLAVCLSWGAFLLAREGRAGAAGLVAGLALLSKMESAPALLAPLLLMPRERRLRYGGAALAAAAAGYALAVAGIPLEELIRYGPLRHLSLPIEFRELYSRVAGLHPTLVVSGVSGALAGAVLLFGWLLVAGGLLGRRLASAGAGLALLAVGLAVNAYRPAEPLLTTGARGLPVVLLVALVMAVREARDGALDSGERREALLALAAGLLALGFVWRTFFWTVPSFPYAPLAAVSTLPAVAWLAGVVAPRRLAPARREAGALLLAPLFLAPLFSLPRLVEFYRSPRSAVSTARGLWFPPGEQGELFARVIAHLQRTGVQDRGLVVLPEASALNFLLGVRSPLRLEQLLPGLLDDGADRDAGERLRDARPERIVVISRPMPEFGRLRLGAEYGRRVTSFVASGYDREIRIALGSVSADVWVRKDAPRPK